MNGGAYKFYEDPTMRRQHEYYDIMMGFIFNTLIPCRTLDSLHKIVSHHPSNCTYVSQVVWVDNHITNPDHRNNLNSNTFSKLKPVSTLSSCSPWGSKWNTKIQDPKQRGPVLNTLPFWSLKLLKFFSIHTSTL